MADHPILFSGPMIRAIIDGRKTQTRRILRPFKCVTFSDFDFGKNEPREVGNWGRLPIEKIRSPAYAVGDRLWIRETFVVENTRSYSEWATDLPSDGRPIRTESAPDDGLWKLIPHYRATEPEPHIVSEAQDLDDDRTRWKSPIHMPRWASRLTLTVTEVRVDRLQGISETDASSEGIEQIWAPGTDTHQLWTYGGAKDFIGCWDARGAYRHLWESLRGPREWAQNPWVVAISFSVAHANIDSLPKSEAA